MMYDSSACMLRMITPGGRGEFLRARRHLDAIQLRHADVENQDVRLMLIDEAQRLQPVCRLRHDRDPGFLQQASQAAADDRVIVSQQHAQAATSAVADGNGSRIASVVPAAGAL